MASITKNEHKSYGMGLHDEVLTGRTQQTFFNPEEGENFFYYDAYSVDFNKRTSIDVEKLQCLELNKKIGLKRNLKILSFSLNSKSATTTLDSISKEKSKYKIYVNIDKIKKFFYSNSFFENDLKNLLASITIISIFKNIHKLDKNIFYDHKVTVGRGDIVKVKLFKKNLYLVDESYNSNPLSLKSAIKNFDMIKVDNSKKHLLLGDMLELGKYSKKLHIKIG